MPTHDDAGMLAVANAPGMAAAVEAAFAAAHAKWLSWAHAPCPDCGGRDLGCRLDVERRWFQCESCGRAGPPAMDFEGAGVLWDALPRGGAD